MHILTCSTWPPRPSARNDTIMASPPYTMTAAHRTQVTWHVIHSPQVTWHVIQTDHMTCNTDRSWVTWHVIHTDHMTVTWGYIKTYASWKIHRNETDNVFRRNYELPISFSQAATLEISTSISLYFCSHKFTSSLFKTSILITIKLVCEAILTL